MLPGNEPFLPDAADASSPSTPYIEWLPRELVAVPVPSPSALSSPYINQIRPTTLSKLCLTVERGRARHHVGLGPCAGNKNVRGPEVESKLSEAGLVLPRGSMSDIQPPPPPALPPLPPNLPHDSLKPNIIASSAICWVIAACFVGLRFYTRNFIIHVIGHSDWSILVALVRRPMRSPTRGVLTELQVFAAATCAGVIERAFWRRSSVSASADSAHTEAVHGSGHHIWDLDPNDTESAMAWGRVSSESDVQGIWRKLIASVGLVRHTLLQPVAVLLKGLHPAALHPPLLL